MADTAKIKTLYTDADKTEVLYPRTKISAITDNDGVGLEEILDNMVYSSDVQIESAKASNPIDANALGGKAPEFYATKNYVKEEVADVINENLADNYLDKGTIEYIYASKSYVDKKVADIVSGDVDIVLDGYVTNEDFLYEVQELQKSINNVNTKAEAAATPEDVLEAKTNAINEAQVYTNQQVKKAAPRNLLDNSDFTNPVNQRGQTSYSDGGKYTIDRWYLPTGTDIKVENGISFSENYFAQDFENERIKRNGVLTAAVMISTGLIVGTVNVSNIAVSRGADFVNSGNFRISILRKSETVWEFYVRAYASVTMLWAALYEGEYTAETLPEYQPKGYENELLVCRQYDPSTGEYIGLRKFGTAHNLLDNSDFRNPVNQRGFTSSTTIQYTMHWFVDRWVAFTGIKGIGINIDGGCVTFDCTSLDAGLDVWQNLENFSAMVGKQYTFALNVDGNVYAHTFTVGDFGQHTIANGAVHLRTRGDRNFWIAVNAGYKASVYWAALYEGEYTADTLPEYQPKGYETELLICRQYDLSTGEYIGLRKFGSAYNLLDNSDFRNPVNQRGYTKWTPNPKPETGADPNTQYGFQSGYSIDRWFSPASNTITINADSINVSNNYFVQRVEAKKLTGSKYTIGFMAKTGLLMGCVDVSNVAVGEDRIAYADGAYSVRLYRESENIWQCYILCGLSTDLLYAFMYEGEYTAETLPEYQPKGYAVELAECQRYFRMHPVNSQNFVGYDNGTHLFIPIKFDNSPMRGIPSLIFTGTFYASSATSALEITTPWYAYSLTKYGVTMRTDSPTRTKGVCLCEIVNAPLMLSADL